MDALKHIPDNVNYLKTEKGEARLQKTDIFKKLMWFSYPREESWIPIPIYRVKEIQQMNKEGKLPEDLGEVVEMETKPVKILDYENVVGQDSLTRLDERSRNKNKNKNRNKNKKQNVQSAAGSNNNVPRQVVAVQPKPQGQKPEGDNANPNKNRNNRPNRNNNPNRPG